MSDAESQDNSPTSRRTGVPTSAPRKEMWTDRLAVVGPIGLFGFAVTTLLLMPIDAKWTESAGIAIVWGYAVAFGGIWQGIAAIFEVFKGNTFGATAFATYSAYWLGWAFMFIQSKTSSHTDANGKIIYILDSPSAWPKEEAVWRFVYAGLTAVFTILTLNKPICLFVTFALLTLTFLFLGIGVFSPVCVTIAGYFGFHSAIFAAYTGFAELFLADWKVELPLLIPLLKR